MTRPGGESRLVRSDRPKRVRAWWSELTFGTEHPVARLTGLAGFGLLTGFGESITILLLVALASGRHRSSNSLVTVFPSSIWVLAGVTIAALLALAGVHVASAKLTARVGADSMRRLRRQLVDVYLTTSWTAQSSEHAGQLQELVMGNAAQVAYGTEQAATGVTAALSLVVVVAAAIVVNPWSIVGLAVIGLLTVAVVRPSREHARRLANRSADASSALARGISETASLARELRAFDASDAAGEHLSRGIDTSVDYLAASRFASQAIPNLSRDLTIAVLAVGLAVIASSGDASLTELGASVVLLLRGLSQAQTISTVAHQLTERTANLERIKAYLGRWQSQVPPAGTRACPIHPAVAFDGVSYRYAAPGGEGAGPQLLDSERQETAKSGTGGDQPSVANGTGSAEEPALQNVTLRIEAGEQVGVVGRTGAGKSTLAAILLGVLQPERGQVLVGDVPLEDLAPHEWHRRVAWVPQDPGLLTGTVADNIRFFRPQLNDSTLEGAAQAAGLGVELASWPERLNRRVGPGGVALSGGQRQRVTLARALAGSPDLIVLDEPTSALDAHTEAAIRASLAALRERVTVVIIAHRAALLEACDRVVMLESGRLVGAGPPGAVPVPPAMNEASASEPQVAPQSRRETGWFG